MWYYFLYCFTTILCVDYLLQIVFSLMKRKYGYKLKVRYFSTKNCLFRLICLAYSLYFILYELESHAYIELLLSPFCCFGFAFQEQKEDYCIVDANYFQMDTDSIGAFWAHQAFDAYYCKVLKSIRERITLFEKEHNLNLLVKKLVIVVPLSCDTRGLLTAKDENVIHIGDLEIIQCDQGANQNRELKNPVYEINETDYIVVEYPGPIKSLWKEKNVLKKEIIDFHRNCFTKVLKDLVKDYPCIVVEYDDTINSCDPLGTFLSSYIRRI